MKLQIYFVIAKKGLIINKKKNNETMKHYFIL